MPNARKRPTEDREVKHGILFEARVSPEIRAGISLARPLLVFGRQSGEAVKTNAASVVSDLTEAVNALHHALGIDCRHLVPDRDILMRRLKTSTDVVISRSYDDPDKTFKHTYVLVDLRTDGVALILILALGSGHQLAEDRNNPFIVRIADEIKDKTPILVFAKNTSRQFRQGWAQAPLREEIAFQERAGRKVYQGTERGLTDDGPFTAANDLLEGEKNRAEAVNIGRNSRRRILTRTGETPVFDPAGIPWHHSAADPPGLISLRLARTARHDKDRYLLLESPRFLPPVKESLDPIPEALDADGNVADQIENVRWYLANAGRDDLTLTDLSNEMLRRGFATQGLRRMQQNPHITFATAAKNHFDPRRNAILFNLDMYETGTLVRILAPKTITLTGAFPPDGPWARPEDFTRIRRWLTRLDSIKQPKVYYTFSGLPLTVDGVPAVLRVNGRGSDDPEQLHYAIQQPDDPRAVRTAPPDGEHGPPVRLKSVRHAVIAEAILQAMVAATRHPVLPITATTSRPIDLVELDRRQHTIARRLAEARSLAGLRQDQVDETDTVTGEPLLSQHRRKQLWEQLDELDTQITDLAEELDDLKVQTAVAEARHDLLSAGAEVDTIVDMLTSLRNTHDHTYRATWLRSIRNFEITHKRVNFTGATGVETTMSFLLRLTDGDTTVDVPARWNHISSAAGKLDTLADAVISDLRRGVTLAQLNDTFAGTRHAYPLIRQKLGFDGYAPQLQCPDPDLLRLHLAVIDAVPTNGHSPTDHDRARIVRTVVTDDLTERFGAVDVLVGRILDRFHAGKRVNNKYYMPAPRLEVTALEISATGTPLDDDTMKRQAREALLVTLKRNGRLAHWDLGPGIRLDPLPCADCGGTSRAMSRLIEVTGYVCMGCRRDAGGPRWDAAFDPYLRPDWLIHVTQPDDPTKSTPGEIGKRADTESRNPCALGVDVVRPSASLVPTQFARPRRKYRQLNDVPADERREITRAYTDERMTLQELVKRHNVAQRVLRHIVYEAGVLRGRGPNTGPQ